MKKNERQLDLELLDKSKDREKTLQQIINKNDRPTWINILDITIMIILVTGLLWGMTQGAFKKVEITCEELPDYVLLSNDTKVIDAWEDMINKTKWNSNSPPE